MNTPKIRFKGFSGDWEQRKFSKFSYYAGKRNKDGLDLVPYSITNEHGFIRQSEAHDEFGYMKNTDRTAYNIVQSNSFAYNPARINVGSLGYYDGKDDVIVSSLYEVFKTDETVCDRLLWYWFKTNSFAHWINKLQEGSVRQYFYYDKLQACKMFMPSFNEQEKIAILLDNLDNLITLHQRKCDSLKQVKKYMLQKMFPKQGEKVPEIRFAGFTGDWEQRKFGDFAKRQSETRMSNSDFPCVEYEDIIAGHGVLNKDFRTKELNKIGIAFSEEDVLYGKLRPYLHNWLNPDFCGVAVGDWWVLKPQNMDKHFLYRLIQTAQYDEAANQSTGTKMPRADWKLISNLSFKVPKLIEEQSKIGAYFSNLDNLITLHQRKSDSLKQVKKYMLQNMFPQK